MLDLLKISDFLKKYFPNLLENAFLSKIQNLTSEKTGTKILLLSCIILVKLQFLWVVVFPSNFWKTTMIWQFFAVILNFSQECYYLKNKVGVVDFTKARGLVKIQSPRAFPGPWALKHYQYLGICKIYYSHFIFEVMYHFHFPSLISKGD